MPDLPAQSPREDRNHRADEQHGRDRKEKLESGPVDDDIAWQAKQRQAFDPGPGQAQQNEARTQSDEQAVHLGSLPHPPTGRSADGVYRLNPPSKDPTGLLSPSD